MKRSADQGLFFKTADDFTIGVFQLFQNHGTLKGGLQGFVDMGHTAFADFVKNLKVAHIVVFLQGFHALI